MSTEERTAYCRQSYRQVAELALEIGDIMLSHGAETSRVEDTICRILRTTGFARAEAYVSLTGIILCLDDPSLNDSLTQVLRVSQRSNNLGRISSANAVSRRFVAGELTVEDALAEAHAIRTQTLYSMWLSLLCLPMIAASFTFMFRGSPRDAAAAFLIGFPVALVRMGLLRLRLLQQVQDFLCAAFLGLATLVFVTWIPLGEHLQPILAGSIMILVPGLPLTVSFRDLIHGDYISGVARLMEAAITALCVAAGVGIVIRLYTLTAGPVIEADPTPWIPFGQDWLLPPPVWFEAFCSCLASVFFCIVFDTERRHLFWCGVAGAIPWFVYRAVELYLPGIIPCNFLAALVASVMAYTLARRHKAPVTIFFTAGIFCLVPGYKFYQTMFYFLSENVTLGVETLLSAIGIAVLIAVAMAVHSSVWTLCKRQRNR